MPLGLERRANMAYVTIADFISSKRRLDEEEPWSNLHGVVDELSQE